MDGYLAVFFIGVALMTPMYVILNYRLASREKELADTEEKLDVIAKNIYTSVNILGGIHNMTEGNKEVKEVKKAKNTLSVSEMMSQKAEEKDYDEFIETISAIIKKQYESLEFLRQDPAPEDYQSGYCLIFQVYRGEYPETYDRLFSLAVLKHLEEGKISRKFKDAVESGKVIPIGDVKIEALGTGISSITQGNDVRVLITFKTQEYIKAGEEAVKKAEKEQAEKVKEDQQLLEDKKEAIQAVNRATRVLNDISNIFEGDGPDTVKEQVRAIQNIVVENYEKLI